MHSEFAKRIDFALVCHISCSETCWPFGVRLSIALCVHLACSFLYTPDLCAVVNSLSTVPQYFVNFCCLLLSPFSWFLGVYT